MRVSQNTTQIPLGEDDLLRLAATSRYQGAGWGLAPEEV